MKAVKPNQIILFHKLGRVFAVKNNDTVLEILESSASNLSLAIDEIREKLNLTSRVEFLLFSDMIISLDLAAENMNADKSTLFNIARWNLDNILARRDIRIGKILKFWKCISEDTILHLFQQQQNDYTIQNSNRFGELLVSQNIIDQTLLNSALNVQKQLAIPATNYEIVVKNEFDDNKNCLAGSKYLLNNIRNINEHTSSFIAAVFPLDIKDISNESVNEFLSMFDVLNSVSFKFSKSKKQFKINPRLVFVLILLGLSSLAIFSYHKRNKIEKNYNYKNWLVNQISAIKSRNSRLSKSMRKISESNNANKKFKRFTKDIFISILNIIDSLANENLIIDVLKYKLTGNLLIRGRSCKIEDIENLKKELTRNKDIIPSQYSPVNILKQNDLYTFTFKYKVVVR